MWDATHGAVGVFAYLEFGEAHLKCIIQQHLADHRFANAEDEFDGFCRLQSADGSGQNTEYTTLGAAWHEAGRRRLREHTAIARAFFSIEDAQLSLKAENAAVDIRLAQLDTGII